MSFFSKLRAAARSRGSLLCVGLDPDPERIPGGAEGALEHCVAVVERTADLVCCYKPNSAFWEQYGADGWRALTDLRRLIPSDLPVLFDAKRGDIGSTMSAYARAAFETLGMDAITASPYLGADSLEELTRYEDRGVYVLCRTSNPGAGDLQHLDADGRPVYLHAAELADRLNTAGNVGLIIGATAPVQLAEVRAASSLPFLVPGVGTQGGDLEASVRAAWNGDPASCLLNASRSVLYAADPRSEAERLREAINHAIPSPVPGRDERMVR